MDVDENALTNSAAPEGVPERPDERTAASRGAPTADPVESRATPTAAPVAHAPEPPLRGLGQPMANRGPIGIVEALLKTPASLLHEMAHGRGVLFKLTALVLVTMALTGLAMAAFSGGLQLLFVPLKVAGGMIFCALICLPSLYILSSLAGAEQSLKETWGALLMGIGLTGVLLVGFAPVTWVFSQATSSVAFMGALHLASLLISVYFGIGLMRRALAAANGRPVSGTRLWGFMFVFVVLQMTTSLRPLIGSYDGLLHDKQFFLAHWAESLSGS